MRRFIDAGRISQDYLTFRDLIKVLGKVFFEMSCIYRLNQRPIFLFSTRRSGSTLLMHMIHSQPRVDYVDEPLNMWRLHPNFQRLPHPKDGVFVRLNSDQKSQLYDYMTNLLQGRIRHRHRGNLVDRHRTFVVDRLIIKNINVTPMIPWFDEYFDAYLVYLVRHPIPVGLSLMRRAWPPIPRAYLENTAFCKENLSAPTIDEAWRIVNQGTELQAYVLEWCLDNLTSFQRLAERSWLPITYEELVTHPRDVSEFICERLDLPDAEAMKRVVERPSRTTSSASKQEIESIGSWALASRWREQVSEQDVAQVQSVLDSFGITAYQAAAPYPSPELCHFGALDSTEQQCGF